MSIVPPGVFRLPLILALICAAALPAAAQQAPAAPPAASQQNAQANQGADTNGRRRMTAFRLNEGESVTLDGQLDEPVWSRAIPASDFMQQDPQNGGPATERTEVRIAFDGEALYMGVTCYDSEPDKWLGYQRRRDEGLGSDDRFMWMIDTFLDGRTGYFFEMNPSGLMADALQGANGQNRAVGRHLERAHRRSEIGWTLEIEIPFRTLNFNPNSDTWGINFQRTVQRKNEESLWMGWARNQGLRRMTNAGRRQRYPRRQPGSRPRHQALRRLHVAVLARTRQLGDGGGCKRRPRSFLQPHAAAPRELHAQHRLRPDRSGPAPGQPDALLAVLPRAARLLPRRRHLLRLRRPDRQQQPGEQQSDHVRHRAHPPVFQPAHRPERQQRAAEHRLRHEAHGTDGRSGRRRPPRAQRRR